MFLHLYKDWNKISQCWRNRLNARIVYKLNDIVMWFWFCTHHKIYFTILAFTKTQAWTPYSYRATKQKCLIKTYLSKMLRWCRSFIVIFLFTYNRLNANSSFFFGFCDYVLYLRIIPCMYINCMIPIFTTHGLEFFCLFWVLIANIA